MGFTRATVKPFYLRLAIDGPAGSGKTFTSLEVATFIAQQYGDLPPAFIDTERGSASKYASRFAFDVIDMDKPFHPDRFVKGIQMAVDAGYKVLVIDSLSHAWNGPGGLLELVDNFAKKYGGNGFAGWKDATPIQTRLIDAIIGANLHIIACMRAKMDYAQDKDERGRTQITKVGLAPIQREGMEYEFDVVGDMTVAHALSISKTRCAELTDQLFVKPGRDFARILWNWTQSGVTREQFAAQAATATPVASRPPPPNRPRSPRPPSRRRGNNPTRRMNSRTGWDPNTPPRRPPRPRHWSTTATEPRTSSSRIGRSLRITSPGYWRSKGHRQPQPDSRTCRPPAAPTDRATGPTGRPRPATGDRLRWPPR